MHICLVVRHFYPFVRPSGVTSCIKALAFEFLKRENVKISVVCTRGSDEASKYQYKGISIYKFNQINLIGYREILKSVRPDKLFFFSSTSSGTLLPLWWAALRMVSSRKEIAFVQTTNFSAIPNKWILKQLLNQYSQLIVCSDQLQKDYLNSCGVDSFIIYPGVDVACLHKKFYRYKLKLDTIVFMGHVSYIKGTDRILELVKIFPSIKFHIIAGKSRNNDIDLALYEQVLNHASKVRNLQFHDATDQAMSLLSECQLMVLPYRSGGTVLGVAQSAIEAMAMGIPVIGTRNSALMPLIVDGKNGYYCETEGDFIDRIQVLVQNPSLLQGLSEGAIATAESKFNISNVADSFLAAL